MKKWERLECNIQYLIDNTQSEITVSAFIYILNTMRIIDMDEIKKDGTE